MSRDPTAVEGEEQADRLPADVVADLLDSERRRHLLACLAAADEPVPVTDLAREVRARETDVGVESVPDDAVGDVREDVYHRHLPKLTATGVVTFDSLVGTVSLATDDERLVDAITA